MNGELVWLLKPQTIFIMISSYYCYSSTSGISFIVIRMVIRMVIGMVIGIWVAQNFKKCLKTKSQEAKLKSQTLGPNYVKKTQCLFLLKKQFC